MQKSIDNLMDCFQVDEKTALHIKKLISSPCSHGEEDTILKEVNILIEGYGLEAITIESAYIDNYYYDIVAVYINTGDTYNSTIVHDSKTGRFLLTTMGDFYESYL